MLGALVNALLWLIGLFIPKTPQVVVQAREAASAETAEKADETVLTNISRANAAAAVVERGAALNPDTIRSPDPDSRD